MSLLFTATTKVLDPTTAAVHTGGWSESFWQAGDPGNMVELARELAQKRAALMPGNSSIIGFRTANYSIVANKLVPGGSSTGNFQFPGVATLSQDLPQVALQMSATSTVGQNKSHFVLRGMPDDIMNGGEYQPNSAYKAIMTRWVTQVLGAQWGFIGRNLNLPSLRIISIIGGVMITDGLVGAAVGDYIRVRRCFNDAGAPVKGSFRVTAIAAGPSYTLALFPNVTVQQSGTARLDQVAFNQFASLTVARAVVRKVGRPFGQYRGRASKRTA
jgi:hypothetical protein